MPKGWDANVWRTDLDERRYEGFFHDKTQAQEWIDSRTEGTYEITDKGPSKS